MDGIYTKPIHPKNSDKYRNSDGLFEFRYGTWCIIIEEEPYVVK